MLLAQLVQDLATQTVASYIAPHDLLVHGVQAHGAQAHGTWLDLGTLPNQLQAQLQAQLQGQQFETDVFKGARNTFNSFIKTGKLWVFLAGLAVGYVLRAVTTYG